MTWGDGLQSPPLTGSRQFGESSGSAVDAPRRADCSTPGPERVDMLRNATYSGFLRRSLCLSQWMVPGMTG